VAVALLWRSLYQRRIRVPIAITMEREPITQHWLVRAAEALRRVANAKTRFSASMSVNRVTMLAAADELETATREAAAWVVGHPCPDAELGGCVTLMLNACAAVAFTAQRALTHPSGNIEAALGRLGDLLATFDFHSQTLGAW
jgi:hypothetical protein